MRTCWTQGAAEPRLQAGTGAVDVGSRDLVVRGSRSRQRGVWRKLLVAVDCSEKFCRTERNKALAKPRPRRL